MKHRTKYPLTQEAKEAARKLVDAWDSGILPQSFPLLESWDYSTAPKGIITLKPRQKFIPPASTILLELAKYGLIEVSRVSKDGYNIMLFQELRHAVEHDFEVSDYFMAKSGNLVEGLDALVQAIVTTLG